eukprot:11194760-Lingulodinium_polyedra.AAC.1
MLKSLATFPTAAAYEVLCAGLGRNDGRSRHRVQDVPVVLNVLLFGLYRRVVGRPFRQAFPSRCPQGLS